MGLNPTWAAVFYREKSSSGLLSCIALCKSHMYIRVCVHACVHVCMCVCMHVVWIHNVEV